MLKILVFDGGWGGDIVSEFLKEELGTVEVKCAIDWDHAPYDAYDLPEVHRLVETALQKYIGKFDLIVLGGYTTSQALETLRRKYPAQKFVGMGVNYHRILKASSYPERVTVMMNENLFDADLCMEIRKNLPFSTIILPDCSDWEELSNYGKLSREVLHGDLVDYFELHAGPTPLHLSDHANVSENRPLIELIREAQQRKRETFVRTRPVETAQKPTVQRKLIKSDVVLLLNTNFWEVKADLEALFGYKTRVLDFRQKLLHDVCLALGLRGVDGNRSK